jgi:hypothetical protein
MAVRTRLHTEGQLLEGPKACGDLDAGPQEEHGVSRVLRLPPWEDGSRFAPSAPQPSMWHVDQEGITPQHGPCLNSAALQCMKYSPCLSA